MNESPKHILISRTDNIGDVILTLPLAGILKAHFPDVKISFLAREYVRAIAEHCVHIDEFISWDVLSRLNVTDAAAQIKKLQIDTVIHVFPNLDIANVMKKAGVKNRIGTTRRWYHFLTCNRFVNFSRAKSDLHEAQLNTKLLEPFGFSINDQLDYLQTQIGLQSTETLSPNVKTFLTSDRFNLIIHPFTNGHTLEWPVSHFNALIRQLPMDRVNVIVTGSSKEAHVIESRIVSQFPHITNAAGKCSLRELIQLIAHADGLVANATGPLHLAAGLGIHALGLYPVRKGIDPARWQPVGAKAEYLTADPSCAAPACRAKNDCVCMESITVEQVKESVLRWL